ncbi:sulfotransferase [Candidatus Pelagibacter ubique]|nr:sulfotransferase [Candidatus Pelagibacter ubique]
MSINLNLPNYIIVLSTMNSGGGAIYDYLSGRGDLDDPLKGSEYQLPQMPNGLMTLEAIAGNAFHPGTSDFALTQFEDAVSRLLRSHSVLKPGRGFANKLKLFENAVKDFVQEISVTNYPMNLEWHRLMRSSIRHFLNQIKNRLLIKEKIPNTRILISKEELVKAAQKMHDKIFISNSSSNPVLLDQAGSGWNPIESTKYFFNRKIILVTRDPRDQFVFMKINKNAHSLNGFIDWYKEMQFRLVLSKDPILINIKFEDFIINHERMTNLICNHLSINSNKQSSYDPNNSKKNIGKYKSFLSKNEIDEIEKNLSDFIYFE